MSDIESPAGSPPQTLHEEEKDDENKEQEAGDYDVEAAGDSDKDSDDELSEIDEEQFGDYDPAAARIEVKPVEIDEDVAKTLKATKRKGLATKQPKVKEGRREKKRRRDADDNDGADGEVLTGKRTRKTGAAASSKKATPEPIDESTLTPEERRRLAIERAAAGEVKNKVKKRKKKDDIDLEAELDEQIAAVRSAMEEACQKDQNARQEGLPAMHKLKMLPNVMSLLNRNNQQTAILDPETNFLEAIRFFLEPLNDGSLPAYNIQRDIFTALVRLPIEKDSLIASGLGKIVLFYTKSKKAEVGIKRMAEKLLGEWSRPILRRTHDYKQRHVETRDFDYQAAKRRQAIDASQMTLTQRTSSSQHALREAQRDQELANAGARTRARVTTLPSSYSVAPKSTFEPTRDGSHRPIGASGIEAFRKMTAKGKKSG